MSNNTKQGTGLSAPMPSRFAHTPLAKCTTLAQAFETVDFRERIAKSAPKHISPERMLRTFVMAARGNPLFAEATPQSFIGACLSLSQLGLEPNTPLGHAYLIPFRGKVYNPKTRQRDIEVVNINLILGYQGLLDLSRRSGMVSGVQAHVVWQGDDFDFSYGTDAFVRHRPKGAQQPGESPLYAYMHAQLKDGQAFEVLPYADVLRIRNQSQGYRAAVAAKENAETKGWTIPLAWTEAPWVKHEIAMARKTAFRSGSKWLPRTIELAGALALDEAQERRQRMDFGSVLDAQSVNGNADYLGAAIDAADQEEQGPAGDPGAAHSDRRESTQQTQTKQPDTKQQDTKGKAAEGSPPDDGRWGPSGNDGQQTTKPETVTTVQQPSAFEAILVDADGVVEETVYTDPNRFASALFKLWSAATDQSQVDALLEHNADAIEAARAASDEAAQVLAMLDEPPDFGSTVSLTLPENITPPSDRGKVSWPGYVKLVGASVDAIVVMIGQGMDSEMLERWASAEEKNLKSAPIGQRVLAIQKIAQGMAKVDYTPPAWLSGLARAPAPAAKTEPQGDADERWAARTLEDAGKATLAQLNETIASTAIRSVMQRLAREKPDLAARVEQALAARLAELGSQGGGK